MAYRQCRPFHARFTPSPKTEGFVRDCREAGVSDVDRAAMVSAVARNPRGGDVIPDSGGARKVRVAAPGRGKSGGYRLIAAYLGENAPVYLLALYLKGDKANLSKGEVAELKKLLTQVKHYWKERQT